MRFIRWRRKDVVLAGSLTAAVAIGGVGLTTSQAEARPIRPLCGPTYQWSCSGPGGPDVLFIGTVCDVRVFERQTGLTCTPF